MAKNSPAIAARKAEDDWEAQSALDTLLRAKVIKANAKLMARVKALANERLKEVAAVAGSDDD